MKLRSFDIRRAKTASAVIALLLSLAGAAPAFAAQALPAYSPQQSQALQTQGKTVLVDVYAPWCPTCRAQEPVLEKLLKEPEFAGITALRLDWDGQREQARALGAPRQSTLLLYRGGKRVGLSVAETNESRLRLFLRGQLGRAAD
ncbi:thioredoxin family protein [Lysobacter enzymogenes]|uniref:thioredoxin family protein n=1 Tax=Lysobacter enzymogenes TaxID=69 RepID=UPI0019D0F441|nr:thioredoxin family protein [Lysobacter enzymogenes]